MICHEARAWLAAEPMVQPLALREHLAGCAACQQYAREMLALEGTIKRALEVDLRRFRQSDAALQSGVATRTTPGAVSRRRVLRSGWALAASVLLAVGVGVSLWALRSEPSLASALVEHMSGERSSWNQTAVVTQTAIDDVLAQSGIHIDRTRTPVVYAHSCVIRGERVPHLVVSTDAGPVTVLLLRDERVASPTDFAQGGYRGVLWPAPDGHGSIAVLARGGQGGDLRQRASTLSAQLSWSPPTH